MPAAARARDFDAPHSQAPIFMLVDGFGLRGQHKAGPAAAGVEFCPAYKQQRPASRAMVVACLVVLCEDARKGPLGAFFTQHPVLLRRKPRAPFGLCACNSFWHFALFARFALGVPPRLIQRPFDACGHWNEAELQTSATTSISTSTSLGKRETSTVVRAGGATPSGPRYFP